MQLLIVACSSCAVAESHHGLHRDKRRDKLTAAAGKTINRIISGRRLLATSSGNHQNERKALTVVNEAATGPCRKQRWP